MASPPLLPITPTQKRAALGSKLGYFDVHIKSEPAASSQVTPGLNDLPELDFDNTPGPNDEAPITPTPVAVHPSVLADGKKSASISLRKLKALKRPSQATLRPSLPIDHEAAGEVIKIELSPKDKKADSVFLAHLCPDIPSPNPVHTATLDQWRAQTNQGNLFDFSTASHGTDVASLFSSASQISLTTTQTSSLVSQTLQIHKHEDSKIPPRKITIKAKAESDESKPVIVQVIDHKPDDPFQHSAKSPKIHMGAKQVDQSMSKSMKQRFSRILPLNAIERLKKERMRCVASLSTDLEKRCSRSVKPPKDMQEKLLSILSDLDGQLDLTAVRTYILEFVNAMTCTTTHRSIALNQLERLLTCCQDPDNWQKERKTGSTDVRKCDIDFVPSWLEAITNLSREKTVHEPNSSATTFEPLSNLESKSFVTVSAHPSLPLSNTGLGSVVVVKKQNLSQTTLSGFNSTQAFDANFSLHKRRSKPTTLAEQRAKLINVNEIHTTNQKFCWFHKNKALAPSVNFHIEEVLKKPLGRVKDQEKGYIYMYWVPGSFNLVKIGYTARTTQKRLKEWEKCGHNIKELTAPKVALSVAMEHVHRVERLVHVELREARLKELCCSGCGKGHNEWFAISPTHAQKVIQKWSDWMKTNPYDDNEKLSPAVSCEDIIALSTPLELTERDAAPFKVLLGTPNAPIVPNVTTRMRSRMTRRRSSARNQSRYDLR